MTKNINITQQIKQDFLKFFTKNNHELVQSSSLVGDETLMFTNSGMVQFKDFFTNKKTPKYLNATSAQNCVRAGGKHNDLENVGYTKRHHTFFEMLGNFSFGGYFKEQAIKYAWDFLNEIGIDSSKLYVTVYHTDEEALNLWKKISGFNESRIIKINTNDNFWSMGNTGPCGPCSEIFYDHGDKIFGGLPGTEHQDGDRYVEIWNMVFMQHEKTANELLDLPQKCIDTGMGLERISAVLHGNPDNYEIDIFKNLIEAIKSIAYKTTMDPENIHSYKIIADHIRAVAFLLLDGIMPSNESRGYVLRRILRRATWHLHLLGNNQPNMHKILPTLFSSMQISEEASSKQEYISQIIQNEEERFLFLINKGRQVMYDICDKNKNIDSLDAKVGFALYDTYGFPLDLIKNVLAEKNVKFDEVGFEKEMMHQKEMGKLSWQNSQGQNKEEEWQQQLIESCEATNFVGYDSLECNSYIVAIVFKNQIVDDLSKFQDTQEKILIVTESTCFYAQSGGQEGDVGEIEINSQTFKVFDTKKIGKLHLHVCDFSQKFKKNDMVTLKVNREYRQGLKIHHTATHLLHAGLRKIVGNHITQKGSFVGTNSLRFDFNSIAPLSQLQLDEIQNYINLIIQKGAIVKTELKNIDEAKAEGAMCLFGDKYEDFVRVIKVVERAEGAGPEDAREKYDNYDHTGHKIKPIELFSIELCGGTHVSSTSEIFLFKIISEKGIASGIRRIEAICGQNALQEFQKSDEILAKISSALHCSKEDSLVNLENLITKSRNDAKEIIKLKIENLCIKDYEIKHDIESDSNKKTIVIVRDSKEDFGLLKKIIELDTTKFDSIILCYTQGTRFIIGKGKNVQPSVKSIVQSIFDSIKQGKGGGSDSLMQGDFGIKLTLEQIQDAIKKAINSPASH